MRSAQLVLSGLLSAQKASQDGTSNLISSNRESPGLTFSDIKDLAEQWSLSSWTEYEENEDQLSQSLSQLASTSVAACANDIYTITEEGHKETIMSLHSCLSSPKRLSQFVLAVGFIQLIGQDEAKKALLDFREKLEQSIVGNSTKLEGLVGTPYEPVTSLCLAQMKATKQWLDDYLSSSL